MGRKRILNLTPQQRKAAELIAFNEDGRPFKDIAAEVGVHPATITRWHADPDFAYLVNEYADQIMETFMAEAYKTLRKMSKGAKSEGAKLKAIELMMKNRGKLKDVQDATVNVTDERTTDAILDEVDSLKARLGMTSPETTSS
jgi:predicted transcriptional regulator